MKILVIRFSSLGDIILSTAILRNIRNNFNDAEIYFYTKEEFVPVLENNPNINYILTWKKKWSFIKNFTWISRREFNLVIDIHNNLRTFILKKILKYEKYISYDKAIKDRRTLVKKKIFTGKPVPVIERYNDVLRNHGLKIVNTQPEIFFSDEEIKWGINYFKENLKFEEAAKCIGISPGAKWPTKQWIPERYINLAWELSRLNLEVLLLGENSDKNFILPFYGKLTKEDKKRIHILSGEFDLRKLFIIISQLKLLVTTDSAPMHVARAFGIPVVLIAGPTVKEFGFFPGEKEGVVVETNLACRPCSLHGSKKCKNQMQTFECMKKIKVENVLDAVKKILDKK